MDAFVPPLAPAVVLALLGAAGLIAVAAVGSAVALAGSRFRLAGILAGGGFAVALGYSAALLGAALLSRDRTLSPGEKKYFCEIDCHLAYSVAGADAAGPERAVTVRTWFDPSTIAPFRGDAPISPNPRLVYLVDDSGRRYPPSAAATRAWEAKNGTSAPLTRPLRPGESYTTTFVFELPEGARAARFFLGDPLGVECLLIGHENSPSHAKAYFALPGGAL